MKMSRRARRMQQQHTRAKRRPGFNIIALMDIFTILVFFLLVNSSDVQEIPTSRDVALPESVVETKPRETLVVKISSEEILFDGQVVTTVAAAGNGSGTVIDPLREVLRRASAEVEHEEIVIMGDRSIPYELLRKVMATCTDAGFRRVSLAVTQTAAGEEL